MVKKKLDIRVKRTRHSIITAFLALAKEEGIDNVTVQEIADRAMINRATFYDHFRDKEDLYDQLFAHAMETFRPMRDPALFQHRRVHEELVTQRLTEVLRGVQQKKDFFYLIFSNTESMKLTDMFKNLLSSNLRDVLFKLGISRTSQLPVDLVLTYVVSTFLGALQWWIRHDDQLTAPELAKLYVKLMKNGHLKLIGIQVDDTMNE